MARRGKASAGEGLVIGVLVVIGGIAWLVSQVPMWVWLTGLGLAAVFFFHREYRKAAGAPVSSLPAAQGTSNTTPAAAVWVPAGHAIQFAGMHIPGGMLYVGKSLPTPQGSDDPCLLNPLKELAAHGDYARRQTDYWPSYSQITPEARRAYLRWLAGGRRDRHADIGFVFLFFYGLERRAIVDVAHDDAAKGDWPVIEREVRELLAVYGDSRSFRGYANALLTWVELGSLAQRTGDDLYQQPVPHLQRGFELPFYLRLAIGQAARARAPLPAQFALEWVRLAPEITLRKPAERCPNEFAQLFLQKYAEMFGAGMVPPQSKTLLKLSYRPASASLRSYGNITLGFDGAVDVAGLPGPLQKLQQLVDDATAALDGYSRYLAKNPGAAGQTDALLKLPAALWPADAQARLHCLVDKVGPGVTVLPFSDLLAQLQVTGSLTRDKVLNLAQALEGAGLGMEPDVLTGARAPKPEDTVVLFAQGEVAGLRYAVHTVARLALELGSTVAMADSHIADSEFRSLRAQIDSWAGLTDADKRRLHAQLQLLIAQPVQLASLKTKVAALPLSIREGLAEAMTLVAQADGTLSAEELTALDKAYKTLGVQAEQFLPKSAPAAPAKRSAQPRATGVIPTVVPAAPPPAGARIQHIRTAPVQAAPASAKPAPVPASAPTPALTLDMERIAALQKDTARVSAILAGIFVEEPPVPVMPDVEPEEETAASEGLLGLDASHSAFARMLLSRPEWSRADLLNLSSDFEVMLDGALERINDAAFDAFDEALTEGEDPVLVNRDVLEKLVA